MANIYVREAVEQDYDALFVIDRLTWSYLSSPGIPTVTITQYRQTHPLDNRLVAVVGDTVCGHLHLYPPSRLVSNAHVAELDIAVHPDYQGRGVGSLLLGAAAELAKRQGKRKLSLRVLATNPDAVRFYKRNGFVEEGRLRQEFYLNGDYVDDIWMAKFV